MNLSWKIFTAFSTSFLVLVAMLVGITQFFAYRNFARYVAQSELGGFEDLAESLGVEYHRQNGWRWVETHPERYDRLVKRYLDTSGSGRPGALPRPGGPRFHGREKFGPPPASFPPSRQGPPETRRRNEPPRLHLRLSLLDAAKKRIALTRPDTAEAYLEIEAGGRVVGILGLASPERLSDPLNVDYLAQQTEAFFVIGACIMVTAKVEEIDRLIGLEIGADNYVCKPFSPREVVARVKAVLRRTCAEPASEKLTVGPVVLDNDSRRVAVEGREITLTPNEFQLLRVLMSRPYHVHTREDLIARVQGYRFEGYDRTIDSHVKNLRKKIGKLLPEKGIIQTVYGVGYRIFWPSSEDE